MLADKKELLKKALIEVRMKEFEDIPAEDELEKEHEFSKAFEKKINRINNSGKINSVLKKAGSFAAGFVIICAMTGAALIALEKSDFWNREKFSKDCADKVENEAGDLNDELAKAEMIFDGIKGEVSENVEKADGEIMSEAAGSMYNYGEKDTGNIVTNLYNEDGKTCISLDYSMDAELTRSEVTSYITYDYSYDVNGTTVNTEVLDSYSDNDTVFSDIDYEVNEEENCIVYVMESETVKELSVINVHLDSEYKSVRLSFRVNAEDGSLELISQDE